MAAYRRGRKAGADKKPYYEVMAEKIIEQLKSETAPWVKPWQAGHLMPPHNPISGTVYKGINNLMLLTAGHDDPRWMTYKQAQDKGWQVRKGSKAETIVFWKFFDGPAAGSGSKEVQLTGKDQRRPPIVRLAKVFNASQVDGIPALAPSTPEWSPNDRAQAIIKHSGADIRHSENDSAFYLPVSDSIHLPPKEAFETAGAYYATLIHEMGHWSGHASRLDRDMSSRFGTPEYAKEELRAEIGSMMMAQELGLAHDPGDHVSYIKNWITILQDDPKELQRAARDADKIRGFLLEFESPSPAAELSEDERAKGAIVRPPAMAMG